MKERKRYSLIRPYTHQEKMDLKEKVLYYYERELSYSEIDALATELYIAEKDYAKKNKDFTVRVWKHIIRDFLDNLTKRAYQKNPHVRPQVNDQYELMRKIELWRDKIVPDQLHTSHASFTDTEPIEIVPPALLEIYNIYGDRYDGYLYVEDEAVFLLYLEIDTLNKYFRLLPEKKQKPPELVWNSLAGFSKRMVLGRVPNIPSKYLRDRNWNIEFNQLPGYIQEEIEEVLKEADKEAERAEIKKRRFLERNEEKIERLVRELYEARKEDKDIFYSDINRSVKREFGRTKYDNLIFQEVVHRLRDAGFWVHS